MSVYKHNYRAYTGEVTPLWSRIYVLARYAFEEAWSSKITVGLFALAQLPFVIFLVGIYLANNPLARALIMRGDGGMVAVDARFFLTVIEVQSWIALVIMSWIAPRLVTFDLSDNALPILLSHPISRIGYVFGKFASLFVYLSAVTWIPAMILFAYEGYSSPQPWTFANLRIATGLLAGSLIWISFLSILGLALSAWVKWRVVATGLIFAAVLVPAGIGGIVSAVMRTQWGMLLNLPVVMSLLWQRLLGAPELLWREESIPTPAILLMLAVSSGIFVAMLNARIRAREVVRG